MVSLLWVTITSHELTVIEEVSPHLSYDQEPGPPLPFLSVQVVQMKLSLRSRLFGHSDHFSLKTRKIAFRGIG